MEGCCSIALLLPLQLLQRLPSTQQASGALPTLHRHLPPTCTHPPTPPRCLPTLCAYAQDCLALGSILAATDSVAALQVISQDRFPLLYSVVFGEGVLNDATSIVILNTIQKFGLDSSEDLTFSLVCIMLLDFVYLALASAVLGLAFGLVTAYCLRAFHFHHVSQA